jgi:hypothetical protein
MMSGMIPTARTGCIRAARDSDEFGGKEDTVSKAKSATETKLTSNQRMSPRPAPAQVYGADR